MDRDVQAAVYDRLLPGWRDAPVKGGERHLRCPLHDDSNPSLRLNEDKLTWFCDPCAVGGGAYDLAVKVRGEHGAKELLEELNPRRTYEVEVLGEVPEFLVKAFQQDRRIIWPAVLQEVGAKLVRARFFDSETQEWKAWHQYVGFPATTKGTWKLWGLNHDHRVGWKVSAGKHDLHLSPTLAGFNGTEIPRLWDVEGESDWLAAIEAGMPYVLAPTGGASSTRGHDRHREHLAGLPIQEVCVEGDLDEAGREGSAKRAEWWRRRGFPVRIVELPVELGEKGDLRDYLNGRPGQNGSAGSKARMGDVAALEALADGSELLPALETSASEPEPADEDERIFQELAQLPRVEYDRRREEAAKQLRIRVSTLDVEVQKRRPRVASDPEQSTPVAEQPEPWDEPVEGVPLLDEICGLLKRFLVLPKHADVAIALWIMMTWSFDSFDTLAKLFLFSPTMRCGKSRTIELLTRVVARALPVSNISPASTFRTIQEFKPTLLIDESDRAVKSNEELIGILNSGHTRATAFVLRLVGDDYEPKRFSTFCPQVIAGIGKLADTLEDRSIIVRMRRKLDQECVERLRSNRDYGTRELQQKCCRWAADHRDTLRDAEPSIPGQLNDRAADNWEPLLAIADAVGGEWPKLARQAAIGLTTGDQGETINVELLRDIEAVFRTSRVDRISSADLCQALVSLEDRPWAEWKRGRSMTQGSLAKQLKLFEIRPQNVRFGETVVRGYELEDFQDTFSRYLPPIQSATPLQANEINELRPNQSATSPPSVAVRNGEKLNENAGCSGVAVWKPPEGGLDKKHPEEPRQDALPLSPEEPGDAPAGAVAEETGKEIVL